MNKRPLVAGALALAAAMFAAGALLPLRAERSDAVNAMSSTAPLDLVSDVGAGNSAIGALLASVEADPDDAKRHAHLGLAYLQKARDAADPTHLPRAEKALERSLELQTRDNLEAFVGMASLSNTRHDFSHSVKWSRRAIQTNPYNAAGYGLLGDALFELGRVGAADAAYQRMVDVRPDVASYVRVSYALQYHQRIPAAIGALRLALEAAGPSGETAAWVRHQLGDVFAGRGDHRAAARQNRIGMAVAPGFVPPTVGLAESYIATGRLDDAVEIMETAARELPSLEYLITLGDLYQVTGRDRKADRQYGEVAATLEDYRRNGVLADADFILFYADRGLRPNAALREAKAIYRDRPTATTADALGWMLHAVGDDRLAWRYARTAIGARGADSAMLFHAGRIAAARGDDERSESLMRRALDLDPAFSLLDAPVARRIVRAG